jgi:16S rRNA (cytosine1402-N4)-methyltransferase
MQIDSPARGFTFKADGPLTSGSIGTRTVGHRAAANFVGSASKDAPEQPDEPYAEIAKRFSSTATDYDHNRSRQHHSRSPEPLNVVNWDKVLTKTMQRTFQALRIEINGEFSALEQFLLALPFALKPRGRVAILTFHSGEDNRVKKSFEDGFNAGIYSDYCKFPIRATAQERYDNPRSKSAQLRWAVRSDAI